MSAHTVDIDVLVHQHQRRGVLDVRRARRHRLEDHQILRARHRYHDRAIRRIGARFERLVLEGRPPEGKIEVDARWLVTK